MHLKYYSELLKQKKPVVAYKTGFSEYLKITTLQIISYRTLLSFLRNKIF